MSLRAQRSTGNIDEPASVSLITARDGWTRSLLRSSRPIPRAWSPFVAQSDPGTGPDGRAGVTIKIWHRARLGKEFAAYLGRCSRVGPPWRSGESPRRN